MADLGKIWPYNYNEQLIQCPSNVQHVHKCDFEMSMVVQLAQSAFRPSVPASTLGVGILGSYDRQVGHAVLSERLLNNTYFRSGASG